MVTSKPLGLKKLPKLDPKIKGLQGEGLYDPYWVLENFKPNPKNYKKHDKAQKKVLFESVQKHGWVVPMVVNMKTKLFVDGHGRVEMAAENNIAAKIGFIYADEDEEAAIIATFDSIALMSETDPEAHQQLLKTAYEYAKKNNMTAMKQLAVNLTDRADRIKDGQTKAKEIINSRRNKLLENRQKVAEVDNIIDDYYEELDEAVEKAEISGKFFMDDVTFSSSNPFEIPDLIPKMLYGSTAKERKELPSIAWNPSERDMEENDVVCYSIRSAIEYEENDEDPFGFLCFYTEDERFEHVYSNASDRLPTIHDQKFKAVWEPDFSFYSSWSYTRKLWSLYKNRWVARYLQEMGTKIIPQIMRYFGDRKVTELDPENTEDFSLSPHTLSLPEGGVKIATMNARMQHKEGGGSEAVEVIKKGVIGGLISAYEYLGTQIVIMYGGLDIEKYIHSELPKDLKIIYMDSYINRRRKGNKEKKRERKAKTERKKTSNTV